MILYDSDDLDLLTLDAPGAYVRVMRPPTYINGQPTNAILMLGTGRWGSEAPYLAGSPEDTCAQYGNQSLAGSNDPHDLVNESIRAFQQSSGNQIGQQQWLKRVVGADGAKQILVLKDTTSGTAKNLGTLEALYKGTLEIKVYIQPSGSTDSFNVVLLPESPLEVEQFPNIAGGSAGTFAKNLQSALAEGINGFRGPSKLARLTSIDATSLNPATVSGAPMTGGNDGRTVTSADFIGSDTSDPKTGIYACRGLDPVPTLMWCAGLVDDDVYPTLMAFKRSEGMMLGLNTPAGTDIASAISLRQSVGIDDPLVFIAKDHVQSYDTTAGVGKLKLVQPMPFIGGRIATLPAAVSPYNKEVYGVSGTERINEYAGKRPYSPADVARLRNNGIMVIQNPITAGRIWGMPHGNSCSSDPVRAPIEWGRMTNYLAHSINAAIGPFAGLNQSSRSNDPLRAQIKAALDEYLASLADNWQIDSFDVKCDLDINSQAMIARHYLRARVRVRYMSSVQFLIVDLIGGTTVITVTDTFSDVPLAA